jgi:hypothetical protein
MSSRNQRAGCADEPDAAGHLDLDALGAGRHAT